MVATARAVSDAAKNAMIYDVAVHPERRGHGLGEALLQRFLDHPRLRGVERVGLGTRDAQPFYQRFGFVESPPRYATMLRTRTA